MDANAKAQDLRRDGKLSAAREQLRACAVPSCPAIVRDDCTKRLDELETAQPTIAFEVKDASGADVSGVKVSVDGQTLTDKLGGTALAVDGGEHVFTFSAADRPSVTRTFVLTEGEKGRRERIVLGAASAGVAAPTSAIPPAAAGGVSPEPPSSSNGPRTRKILGLFAGGVGVAGLGVGAVLGVLTVAEKNKQISDCPSATLCNGFGHTAALADHSSALTDSAISTAAFIAGGVLLVGGAVLFFTAGHSSSPATTTGIRLVPSVGPDSANVWLVGAF